MKNVISVLDVAAVFCRDDVLFVAGCPAVNFCFLTGNCCRSVLVLNNCYLVERDFSSGNFLASHIPLCYIDFGLLGCCCCRRCVTHYNARRCASDRHYVFVRIFVDFVVFLICVVKRNKDDNSVFNGEADRLSLNVLVIAVGVLRNHCLRQGILAVGKSFDYGVCFISDSYELDRIAGNLKSLRLACQNIIFTCALSYDYFLKRILRICVVQRQGKFRSLDLFSSYLSLGDVDCGSLLQRIVYNNMRVVLIVNYNVRLCRIGLFFRAYLAVLDCKCPI